MSVSRYVLALVLLLAPTQAYTQDHHHPPQDVALHEKFYMTWYMPDNPTKSCCNKADCYPTEVTYRDGQIYAMRREDHKWMRVPPEKIEQHRDNPDGRNHMCAPPPPSISSLPDTIYCFALGTGI